MISKSENLDLKNIAKHVEILNSEVGRLQGDVKWIKKIVYYMAGILSAAVAKIIFFGGTK